jgi:hypothetical protein
MRLTYRFGQGIRALFAFTQSVEVSLAEAYLNPSLLRLFQQLKRNEQLHSLSVLRDVLAQGETPHDLAVAALLHDVGKVRYPVAVWQKTLAVAVRELLPQQFIRWSQGDPRNPWQRAFVVYVQHPQWSAALLAEAGASERACWLAAHHAEAWAQWQTHPYAPLLQRLKQADDSN